jgi:hypothetical protein
MHYAASPEKVPARWGLAGWLLAAAMLAACRPGDPVVPAEPATTELDGAVLCRRIEAALAHARDGRLLDGRVHGAWQVVHGILAFGPELPLATERGRQPALDYLLGGGPLTGWKLRLGSHGVAAIVEEGSTMGQGHPDQWLGYLAQCGVGEADGRLVGGIPLDTPLTVGGRTMTIADLLAQACHDIRDGQEATWTLMALAAWMPPDASWTAGDGARWTTERVVRMESAADIPSAACGGAHRLYGLAVAVDAQRRACGGPPQGAWAEAARVVEASIDRARRFQQPDGSFAVRPFERPGTSPDVFARLSATGHAFEVLAVALDDDRLLEPWVVRAAERLVSFLEETADLDVECGGLYHAAHGLAIYRRRVCAGARGHGFAVRAAAQ